MTMMPLHYQHPSHRDLPHVVKVSGGRSSGMMLVRLIEDGALHHRRGDIVVFNNTTAEHPATYRFLADLQNLLGEQTRIPFACLRFQTYEVVRDGLVRRLPTYRMEKLPGDYECRGEAFEELVSWKGILPNVFSRICTDFLKRRITEWFLLDWFSGKTAIDELGDSSAPARMTIRDVGVVHRQHGGKFSDDELQDRKAYMMARPHVRPRQQFADFVVPPTARHPMDGLSRNFSGVTRAYVSLVGLRADEPHRVAKLRRRTLTTVQAEDGPTRRIEEAAIYTPLVPGFGIGRGVDGPLVRYFWRHADFDLALPNDSNASNCVFCHLKSAGGLRRLAARQESIERCLPDDLKSVPGTPSDIQWWVDIEARYGRPGRLNLPTDGPAPTFGFFGGGKPGYAEIAAAPKDQLELLDVATLPCDCTD